MKISLNWLKDFVDFDKKLTVPEIAWKITEAAAEIERVDYIGKGLEKIVIGKIKELQKHPNADKLHVCLVDVGTEVLQVVCGGKNLSNGMLVAVALPGSKVKWHGEGELVEIKKTNLRGVDSTGMICAGEEIGLEKMFPSTGEHCILDLSGLKAKPGQEIAETIGADDIVFDIDNHAITHRSDLFSHYGMARECVALGLAKWKKKPKAKDYKKMTGSKTPPLNVEIKNQTISKNYYGTVIKGLSTRPAPQWMSARLNAVGIRSINAIVDITNYVMMDVGQPNHAFDLKILEGQTFVNRLSKKGEKVKTLDGIERTLEEGLIIGETKNGIIDLAGIMGAENSEIKENTTDIYFHAAQFNNVMIRKAMITLGHRTEGGTMHEKNIEAERSELGYIRGLELFKEIFPEAGIPYKTIHIQHEQTLQTKIEVPLQKIKSHLGIEINPKKSQKILEDLGFVVKAGKNKFEVIVPSWRSNGVRIPEDLVEEIVRIYGYSNVTGTPPAVELATPVKNHKRHVKRTIQNILIGLGFQEESNYSFLSAEHLKKTGNADLSDLIEIANPVSEDFQYMRLDFLPYLLSNLSRNELLEPREWKTFEMGAVYKKLDQEIIENHLLTIMISSPGEDFFKMKGTVEDLLKELALPCQMEPAEHIYAHPKKCLAVVSEEKIIGHIYELHPLLKRNFKIRGNVVLFEAGLSDLYQLKPRDIYYQPINRNPFALLDVSVIVGANNHVSDFEKIIRSVNSDYLKKIELMDVYQGASIGEGKKSLTFSLAYQHPERTFDEKEIQTLLDQLIKKIEEKGGIVRR